MRRIVNRYVNKRIDWIICYDPDDISDEVKNMFLGIISNYQQVLYSVTNTREEQHGARAYNALLTQELMKKSWLQTSRPVSYTHLTLPTIYPV